MASLYNLDERTGFELFFELWDEFLGQQCQLGLPDRAAMGDNGTLC